MSESRGDSPDWQKGSSNSNHHSLCPCWAEKQLTLHNTPNLEVDRPQQKKTTSGSIPVSQEQESEVTLDRCSSKLDSWKLGNVLYCISNLQLSSFDERSMIAITNIRLKQGKRDTCTVGGKRWTALITRVCGERDWEKCLKESLSTEIEQNTFQSRLLICSYMQLFIILFGITVRCWPVFLGIAHHSDHSSDRLDSKGWQPWSKGWVVCVGGFVLFKRMHICPMVAHSHTVKSKL